MNALIIDTSSWIAYFAGRGHPNIDSALEDGRVYLPPLVCAELLSGKMPPKQREVLKQMLDEIPLCECDFEHWVNVGLLRSALREKGYTLSTPDAHIAQCTLDLNGHLLSEDKIFEKIHAQIALKVI